MNIKDLLKRDSVILNRHCHNKAEVLDTLIERHYECHHLNNKQQYKEAILTREALSSTGVGNMIAIPHAQDDSVQYPSLVAMVDREGVDFDSLDQQPAKIFFMIAVPKNGGSQHLEILAQLCQILMDEKTVDKLLQSATPEEFIYRLTGEMEAEKNFDLNTGHFDVVAVTACPTGIAHTYMAAKTLEEAAKEMGIQIKVETNGASGVKNKLSSEEIRQSKCVIVAADKKVEMTRFNGKELIQVPVAKGIHEAKELLEKAITQSIPIYNDNESSEDINNEKGIRIIYKHLMNGISNIIPVLMITGVLSSLIMIVTNSGLINRTDALWMTELVLKLIQLIGHLSLAILAAFIADSISERPGFIVAFITALISLYLNGGIIEVIIIGFLLGYLIKYLQRLFVHLPEVIETIVPNILLPISGILFGIILLTILGQISITSFIQSFLASDSQIVFIGIGVLLGMMMSIDMGGPINKIAYTFGIIGIGINQETLMSAVMLAGMIPPIVISLSMLIFPSKFNEIERKGKWRCFLKGLCFVSEEAIPYMSNDKKGIHIPCIIASSIAGGLSVYFQTSQNFPHGGIFVLPLIQKPHLFILSMLIATIGGLLFVIILRKPSQD